MSRIFLFFDIVSAYNIKLLNYVMHIIIKCLVNVDILKYFSFFLRFIY